MNHLSLDDDQRRRIEAALEDLEDRSPLEILQSSVEYHYFVWHYNFDDGIQRIRDIVTAKECDKGTALLAYWLCDPAAFEGLSQSECSIYLRDLFDCIQILQERLVSGNFTHQEISVDPKNLLLDGDDWTQNSFAKNLPSQLTHPTPGTRLPEDDLQYKLNAEDRTKRESQSIQDDLESLQYLAKSDPAYQENLLAYQRWMAQRDAEQS